MWRSNGMASANLAADSSKSLGRFQKGAQRFEFSHALLRRMCETEAALQIDASDFSSVISDQSSSVAALESGSVDETSGGLV